MGTKTNDNPGNGSSRRRGVRRNLGLAYLGLLVVLPIIFFGSVLEFFESYDHVVDTIAFRLLSSFGALPSALTHDLVMGFGFALLGLMAVIPPAALGIRRSWVVVALVFFVLNIGWWYTIESEVAEQMNKTMAETFNILALSAYAADSIGALLGALAGVRLLGKFVGPAR